MPNKKKDEKMAYYLRSPVVHAESIMLFSEFQEIIKKFFNCNLSNLKVNIYD